MREDEMNDEASVVVLSSSSFFFYLTYFIEHASTTMDGTKFTSAQFVEAQERAVLSSLWVRHVFRGVQPGLCA